jgi:hypothetical protein
MSLSLRSFHLFFIAVSILLAALVGAWGVQSYRATGETSGLWLGVLFFVLGFILVVYGLKVRRKLRDLGPED